MPRITLWNIAQEAGVSKMTVSLALRGSGQIPEKTRQRIREAAARLGYQPDARLQELMAHIRADRTPGYQAVIAVAMKGPPEKLDAKNRAWVRGIEARTASRGYGINLISLTDPKLSPAGTARMLTARGIKGVIFVGLGTTTLPPAFKAIYENFACVVIGLKPQAPPLHYTMTSNYSTAHLVFTEVVKAGYRRPGVILNAHLDVKEQNTISSGFSTAQRNEVERPNRIPFLNLDVVPGLLLPWFEKHRPDCIIADGPGPLELIRNAGIRVPEDTAFAAFDREPGLAGADQHDTEVGATAVDMLIGQLHRGEQGIPASRRAMIIESSWEPGPTLPILETAPHHTGEHDSWLKSFDLAAKASPDQFATVDLASHVNRSMANFDGPFYPMLHFPPGKKTIHGVPFLVLDDEEHGNSILAVSAKPSADAFSRTAREATIPVRKRVKALYFLHCALYAKDNREFGRYEFVEESGRTTSLPLVPYGNGIPSLVRDVKLNRAATIQDWFWPENPVVENRVVKPVYLHKPGDPDLYSRWLYTLEWQAPEPEGCDLRAIRIKPTGTTNAAVMLLAITALVA